MKNLVLCDESRRIHYLGPTYEGAVHDKRMADESELAFKSPVNLLQDTGFQGFESEGVQIIQPKKKPKGSFLTAQEKFVNRVVGRLRVKVEHAIGSMKIWRIVKETCRSWLHHIRDELAFIACGLHNFRLSQRIET